MIDFHDDVDPASRLRDPGTIEIKLTPAEFRAIVEHGAGGPCFRIWFTADEWKAISAFADWPHQPLSDGRVAVWRKESDLAELRSRPFGADVADEIESRRLDDNVM